MREFLHSYTTSGFQIAPLPFDARSDTIVISADNVFNPFGIDFGAIRRNQRLPATRHWRLEDWAPGIPNRRRRPNQLTLGLRGKLFKTNWEWDANVGYGGIDQDIKTDGYLFLPLLSRRFGPNFIDADGNVDCGTPTAPIAGLHASQSVQPGVRAVGRGLERD